MAAVQRRYSQDRTGGRFSLRRYLRSELFWIVLVGAIGIGVLTTPGAMVSEQHSAEAQREMLFVGDIMLARHVETLMDIHGAYYPFMHMRDLFREYDIVIGNFEASIPEVHRKTPNGVLRFSVRSEFAPILARVGFTHLTLANNHSDDYGASGYEHTVSTLAGAGLGVSGHASRISEDDISYHDLGTTRVALVPINATYRVPAHEDIRAVISAADDASDVVIVSIHWGTEYALSAGASERALAELLIDSGARAVIGHHPHVTQQVDRYRGAPIFYSIGNFIFDQYWNRHVQEGLAIGLAVEGNELVFSLLPISSEATKSAPQLMGRAERTQFLSVLAERSAEAVRDDVRSGTLRALFRGQY